MVRGDLVIRIRKVGLCRPWKVTLVKRKYPGAPIGCAAGFPTWDEAIKFANKLIVAKLIVADTPIRK